MLKLVDEGQRGPLLVYLLVIFLDMVAHIDELCLYLCMHLSIHTTVLIKWRRVNLIIRLIPLYIGTSSLVPAFVVVGVMYKGDL